MERCKGKVVCINSELLKKTRKITISFEGTSIDCQNLLKEVTTFITNAISKIL